MAHRIAAKLHEFLDMRAIVDNRSSAGGILAAELTGHAAPDGQTLFMASSSALFIAPAYFKKVSYGPLKDFTQLSLVAQRPRARDRDHRRAMRNPSYPDTETLGKRESRPVTSCRAGLPPSQRLRRGRNAARGRSGDEGVR